MALDAVANVVMRDHLLQERARLETNLQQARRMETVGALASGIAHNFNNIVGAILGHTEMAEEQLAPNSQPARNLKEIRRAGERARDLVDQILAFGRCRDLRRRPVSMKGLVAETSSLLHVSLPSRSNWLTGQQWPAGPELVGAQRHERSFGSTCGSCRSGCRWPVLWQSTLSGLRPSSATA
jgi:C4-dicarboxylate-specific signal transduction histidine kinase